MISEGLAKHRCVKKDRLGIGTAVYVMSPWKVNFGCSAALPTLEANMGRIKVTTATKKKKKVEKFLLSVPDPWRSVSSTKLSNGNSSSNLVNGDTLREFTVSPPPSEKGRSELRKTPEVVRDEIGRGDRRKEVRLHGVPRVGREGAGRGETRPRQTMWAGRECANWEESSV